MWCFGGIIYSYELVVLKEEFFNTVTVKFSSIIEICAFDPYLYDKSILYISRSYYTF